MGEFTEKVKGATNEAIGNTKQVVGDAIDSPTLEKEGIDQEAKGEMQHVKGEAEGALGNDI